LSKLELPQIKMRFKDVSNIQKNISSSIIQKPIILELQKKSEKK
jgi:hypothetical protein